MISRISIKVCVAAVICAGMLAGCHDRHKVKERREVVTEHAPPPERIVITEPPPPAQEVVIVREAPPPVIVETMPPPPAVGMIWVQGYWVHDHGHYAWCKGRYIRPEPDRRFEPARWEHSRRGWEFHGERWTPHDRRDDRRHDRPDDRPHGRR